MTAHYLEIPQLHSWVLGLNLCLSGHGQYVVVLEGIGSRRAAGQSLETTHWKAGTSKHMMCSLAFKQAGNTTSPTGFSSNKTTNLPIRCVACVSDIKFSPPFMSQSNFSFFLSPFNYRETFSCFAVGIQMMSQDEKSSRYVGPSGFACANALIWDATT